MSEEPQTPNRWSAKPISAAAQFAWERLLKLFSVAASFTGRHQVRIETTDPFRPANENVAPERRPERVLASGDTVVVEISRPAA